MRNIRWFYWIGYAGIGVAIILAVELAGPLGLILVYVAFGGLNCLLEKNSFIHRDDWFHAFYPSILEFPRNLSKRFD